MMRTSWVPAIAWAVGALLLTLALGLPWAYIGGEPVSLDWVGVDAAIPALLLGAASVVAITWPRGRRWTVLIATLLGLFAGYTSLSLARAIPTMAAVWAESEGSSGPAVLAIVAAEATLLLAAWSTLLPAGGVTFSDAE